MHADDDKQGPFEPHPASTTAGRFFLKWGLISLAVVVVLIVIESLLMEFSPHVQPSSSQQSFQTYGEFITTMESQGYVFLGRFHDQWPARIVQQRTAMNEIEFELSDGTRHRYPHLDGYELKLVRLATDAGNEAVVVLRSAAKKPAVD